MNCGLIQQNHLQIERLETIVDGFCEELSSGSPLNGTRFKYPVLAKQVHVVFNSKTQDYHTLTPRETSHEECMSALTEFDWNNCNNRGITYRKLEHDTPTNTDRIGCPNCDAISGNTSCYNSHSLVCFKNQRLGRPNYLIRSPNTEYGWTEGSIGGTNDYMGCLISSRLKADIICVEKYGTGWKIANSEEGRFIQGMMNDSHTGSTWINTQPKFTHPFFMTAIGNLNDSEPTVRWIHNNYGFNCY